MRAGLAAVMVVTAVACGSSSDAPDACARPASVPSRDDAWRADLRCLSATLKARHPDPFASVGEAEFDAAAAALAGTIPSIPDPQAAAGLMALAAMLRDGHTYVFGEWTPLALRLRRFPEGIFVVGAAPGVESWPGSRVVAIGGIPIDEARARVAALIPQENEQTVASREAGLLEKIEVLQQIGAVDPAQRAAELVLENPGGTATVRVGPMTSAPVPFPSALPRSLTRVEVPYWFEVDAATRTLYVQYNACVQRKDLPMAQFAAQVQQALAGGEVDRAVLDLRWNGGGASDVNLPLEAALRAWPGSADPARFSILVGPATFSSGMWAAFHLGTATSARLLGETPGGNPNGFGDVVVQTLPWSRLRLQYSTRQFHLTDDPANRVRPDQVVLWTWPDYANGIDPLLIAAGLPGR